MRFRFVGRLTLLSTLCVAVTSMANPRVLPEEAQKRANEEANTFKLSSTVSAKPIEKEIVPSQVPDDEPHGLGALPITEERLALDKKRGREVKKIKLNKIGLARVNAERAKKGLPALVAGVDLQVAPVGFEVETEADAGGSEAIVPTEETTASDAGVTTSELPASAGETGGANPSAVNNSTLKFFPPIGDQGQVNSCVGWAEIYYTMTHETALQYDRDVKAIGMDAVFSPLFTYNFLNGGLNDGTYFGDHYDIAQKHGAVRYAEMPAPTSFTRTWDTTAAHYRRAIDSRIDGYGYISSLNTADGLALLKTHLANGHIASYRTDFDGWVYKTLSNDPNTTGDDAAAGKWSVSAYNSTSSGHGMAVLGYNDEVWCDINGNGVIDAATEKGGLLIANSWGTDWKSAGYCYIPYSILQTTYIFSSQSVYIATIKPVQYSPSVMAKVTLNHNLRNQVTAKVGKSATNKTAPDTILTPEILFNQGGAYAFSGATATAQDFTYYLDMTELAPSMGTAQRWYVQIMDSGLNDGNLTLKAFDLIYSSSGTDRPVGSCSMVPLVGNGSTQNAYIEWEMGDVVPAVTVTATDAQAAEEGQGAGTWTITRDGSTAASLAVYYSLSGTAAQGADYTVSPASPVTIAAGQASATVTLTPVDDVVADEGTELATLTIQPNAAYYVAAASASVAIADNDLIAPAVSNQGWTATGTTSADLSGVIVSGEQASVWICWGEVDGGTATTGSWENVDAVGTFAKAVPFTATVTGMGTNTTYWYRFHVSNAAGTGWSGTATAFSGNPVGAGGPWTPADMDTVAWYDAADTNTLWADVSGTIHATSSVARWDDKSGNGRYVSQGTEAAKPITATRTMNGRNALDFSRTAAQSLSVSANLASQPLTAIAVAAFDTAGENLTLFDGYSSTRCFLRRMSTDVLGIYAGSYLYGQATSSEAALASVEFNGASSRIRKNGGTATTGNPGTGSLSAGLTIGNIASPDWTYGMDGLVCELVFASGLLSDADRQKIEGYLAHKWGLQESLPTDHPYRNLPPGGTGADVAAATTAPSGITDSTATLNGFVSAPSTNVDIHVHWGLSDGGSNSGAWAASVKVGSCANSSTNVYYAVTGLNPGQTYYYTFSASNAATNVWASPSWTFRTSGETSILAPSDLSATPGSGQITLAWTDSSTNETGFRVERSQTELSGFAMIGAAPENATIYTDSVVSAGTTYYYRVAATNATDSSVVSATASASLPKPEAKVMLSNLSQTYSGAARTVTTTTDPVGLTVAITYNGIAIAPTNAGSYAVVATIDDATYQGTTNGTLVVGQATPTVTAWPTAAAIVESQSLVNATLSGGSASVPGTFGFNNPAYVPPVGTNTVAVTFSANDAVNYFAVGGTVDVVVEESYLAPPAFSNQGWIATGTTSADLAGVIAAGEQVSVWICWGVADDGTASTGNWDQVEAVGIFTKDEPFAATVTGMATNATYWYRFYGTNAAGTGWSASAIAFSGSPVEPQGEWTPSNVAAVAWYDACDTNTITLVSGKVSQWKDKSGNSRHALQGTTTKQPTYRAADTRMTNMPSIGYDNAYRLLVTPTMSFSNVYVVTYYDAPTFDNWLPLLCDSNNVLEMRGRQNYAELNAGRGFSFYRDGATTTTTAFPRVHALWRASATTNLGNVAWHILGGPNTWQYWKYGAVGELIFTDGNEGLPVRQKIEGYLAHKWKLAGNLPADHPYKDAPPGGGGDVVVANLAPGDIAGSTATLNGLISALATNVDVYVHWGLSDGGTNAGAWTYAARVGSYTNTSDTVSYPAEGLNPGQVYHYTFSASNATGRAWAQPSWQFATADAGLGSNVYLTVYSAHGTPSPSGVTTQAANSVINASISGSPVFGGTGVQYVATGWISTGSLTSGTGTNTIFTITNDTTITWQWQTNYWVELGTTGN